MFTEKIDEKTTEWRRPMTRNLHGAFLVSREIYPNPVTECYGARNRRTKNQVASDGKLPQNGCQIFESVDKNRPHKVNTYNVIKKHLPKRNCYPKTVTSKIFRETVSERR